MMLVSVAYSHVRVIAPSKSKEMMIYAGPSWAAPSGNVTDEVWKVHIRNKRPPESDDDFTVV
jgi:hypothetical protein